MPLIIKPSQAEQVRKLVSRCCNWDEGTCLLLEMPCPQQLSLTRINCRYFREAVLPANQRLYQSIMNNNYPRRYKTSFDLCGRPGRQGLSQENRHGGMSGIFLASIAFGAPKTHLGKIPNPQHRKEQAY